MAVSFDVDTEDCSGALWDTGGPTNQNSLDYSVRIWAWLNVGWVKHLSQPIEIDLMHKVAVLMRKVAVLDLLSQVR